MASAARKELRAIPILGRACKEAPLVLSQEREYKPHWHTTTSHPTSDGTGSHSLFSSTTRLMLRMETFWSSRAGRCQEFRVLTKSLSYNDVEAVKQQDLQLRSTDVVNIGGLYLS